MIHGRGEKGDRSTIHNKQSGVLTAHGRLPKCCRLHVSWSVCYSRTAQWYPWPTTNPARGPHPTIEHQHEGKASISLLPPPWNLVIPIASAHGWRQLRTSGTGHGRTPVRRLNDTSATDEDDAVNDCIHQRLRLPCLRKPCCTRPWRLSSIGRNVSRKARETHPGVDCAG